MVRVCELQMCVSNVGWLWWMDGYYTFRRDQFDKVVREDADLAAQFALQPALVGQFATEYGYDFAVAQLQLVVVGRRVRIQHLAQFAHYGFGSARFRG